MTISKKDAKYLFILLDLVILVVGYAVVYNHFNNKAEELRTETAGLQAQLTELRGYSSNLDQYKTGIQSDESTINQVLADFPTDVRYEDLIMYATDMRDKLGLQLTSLDFEPLTLLQEFDSLQDDGNGQYTQVTRSAYSIGMTVSCDLSYKQMKSMIDYIASSTGRTTLDTLNVSYNSTTGELTGSVALTKYFITSGNDPYVATMVPQIALGRSDLFGTVSPSTQAETQPQSTTP